MQAEEPADFGVPTASQEVPIRRSLADELLDDVLPERFEWRRVVRRYPLPALLLASLGGYWLGSRRGRDIVAAAADYATETVDRQLDRILNVGAD